MATTSITADPAMPFIDIRREFDAPPELLFRAYSEPELLIQWLGPSRYQMVIDEYDVRDGGRWRYVHRADDGAEYAFHGVFHGPQGVDGMLQTFEFEGAPGHVSLDQLTFAPNGARTIVHIHSVYQSVEARDATVRGGMAAGLDQGFARLDDLIGRLQPVG
jgi:uncharacterized protein YndB with AHSA1/START domain